ncbi:MAG: ribosome biogenesis GTPase Der [Desulfovibrionaceae bacterium]|nr:ribosome biogenesis GTPase Der [Desulfovibrionaceae bacterium]
MLPKVLLLGRPNVGKSTLFNRLIRSRRAITHDRPGVTRDRMEGVVGARSQRPFILVDTGGITLDGHHAVVEGPQGIRGFEADILRQAEAALAEAGVVCLVVDGRDGLTPFDEHLASHLRRFGTLSLLVVNKVDGAEREDELTAEFHRLGLPLLAVSAEHGYNIRALEEEIRIRLPGGPGESGGESGGEDETGAAEEGPCHAGSAREDEAEARPVRCPRPAGPLKLCLLGRPNAGKSSLVNAYAGEERMIVSEVAGTTRDSVDIPVTRKGRDYIFVDTAGVRRRARITDTVERFSVNSALKSTTKAHVTLLALDAAQPLTAQDKRLIELLDERKTPFLVVLTKIDLVPAGTRAALKRRFAEELSFCSHVPVLTASSRSGEGLQALLDMADRIRSECAVRVSTGQLNRAMEEALARHQAPVVRRVRPKFFYLTQAESEPPTFVFFVNDAERVAESYVRYLEKSLRRIFGIRHAPMRVRLRSSHGARGGAARAPRASEGG